MRASSSLKEKQRILDIINKIITLISKFKRVTSLGPQVIADTINPVIIARQLRSFLNSSNGYHSSKSKLYQNNI